MSQDVFSIGDVARTSGLSVSALRFYDRQAVLIPISVDPLTGYRWYSSAQVRSAELIAVLRRVGLPLPEISKILALQGDQNVLRSTLAEHVERLEAGLTSAKALISQIERQWTTTNANVLPKSAFLSASEFHRALSSVRFASGSHDDFPALAGICLIAREGHIQVLASDRHRAAFDSVQIDSDTVEFRIVLAQAGLNELFNLLLAGGVARMALSSGLQVTVGTTTLTCPLLDLEFPDFSVPFQPVLRSAKAEVDRHWIRTELGKRPSAERRLVGVDYEGRLLLDTDDQPDELTLLLNASYLSEAVEAAGSDQLCFELNGSIAPLAIRNTQNPNSFSVIMPILQD